MNIIYEIDSFFKYLIFNYISFIAITRIQKETTMKTKALIVVTSHSQLGKTGKPTGYYLPEVTHPYFELEKAGFEIDVASPLGGEAPMDPSSKDLSDEANRKFLQQPFLVEKLKKTIPLGKINPKDYSAILFAGGHGTMWDFADSTDIHRITAEIFENQGVVAAVCHGPAALVNVKLSNGRFLVDGKRVTGFSNAEEEEANLTKVMPFLLQTALEERQAKYEKAPIWKKNVVTDGNLVTGQNPASAADVGKAIVTILQKK